MPFPAINRPGPAPAAPSPPVAEDAQGRLAGPSLEGTVMALIGLAGTALTLPSDGSGSATARQAAIGVALSLGVSLVFDLREGIRNLLRADLLAILAFYFLSLLEFLFPQPIYDEQVDQAMTVTGLYMVFLSFAGLMIGRHFWRPNHQPMEKLMTREIPSGRLVALVVACAAAGYFHMLLAVNFNVMEMLNAFVGPRFNEPWARGKLGDWKSLFTELVLLIQLIPPVAGIMLARRGRYPSHHFWIVMSLFLFTAFYGFSSGTRNLFGTYMVTFLMGFALALKPSEKARLIAVTVLCALCMLVATRLMLDFRAIGLKRYVQGEREHGEGQDARTFFVDYNLLAMSRIADSFPREHGYLGFEIPYQALIRPIPRALWPGKPQELSTTIEDVFGQSGLTISATYAGEAYMSAGWLGVIALSLLFGGMAGWWNGLASARNSEIGILIFASGFFAVIITMRSMFVLTTAALPTIAGIVGAKYLVPVAIAGVKKLRGKRDDQAMGGLSAKRTAPPAWARKGPATPPQPR